MEQTPSTAKLNKYLKKFYRTFINQKFYRIMPLDQKENTVKTGLDPSKDPYKKLNPKIKKMFKIIERLEEKGIVFTDVWRNGPVNGRTIVEISNRSVEGNYIDFVGNKQQIEVYKKRWIGGGCLATYTLKLAKFLLKNSKYLSASEKKLVQGLNKWARGRKNMRRFIISIQGTNKCFESALFYRYNPEFDGYWKSPFGSFEHFRKVIKNKKGLEKYLPYLKNKKLFYLRTVNKINPKEITFEKGE